MVASAIGLGFERRANLGKDRFAWLFLIAGTLGVRKKIEQSGRYSSSELLTRHSRGHAMARHFQAMGVISAGALFRPHRWRAP